MLQALIFDFDGLILDTETPEVRVWEEIYREHGFELPIEEWAKIIGGYGLSTFDPAEHLAELTAGRLNAAELRARYRREADARIAAEKILPGALELMQAGKRAGLKLAIGSSSPRVWVEGHARRLGIFDYFDEVVCGDDVPPGRTKPNPDIYLKTLEKLNVESRAAVVFEDSPNGVLAARRANIFVVAAPNPLTARLGVQGDWTVASLADLSLQEIQDVCK